MSYTYLAINFFTIIIPLAFSFHPWFNFHKTWKPLFPALCITGVCFLIWDSWFVWLGVWGFNPHYLTGLKIGNLPVEELLFFVCIPYACVFTFHSLGTWFQNPPFSKRAKDTITVILLVVLLVSAVIWHQKIYTLVTCLSLAALLVLCRYMLHIQWLGRFYITYSLLLFPFFIVDGILTGSGLREPVVWYTKAEIIGIRIATIPLEDAFYGMELILMNLAIWKKWGLWTATFRSEPV